MIIIYVRTYQVEATIQEQKELGLECCGRTDLINGHTRLDFWKRPKLY